MENLVKVQDDSIVTRIKTDLKVIIPSFDFNNYLKKDNTHSKTVEKFCATLWDGSDLEVESEIPSINSSLSKSGVFSPAHSIKGPSPSLKQKPLASKEEYHSTLYRVSSKSDGNKTVITREMSLPSETLGTVSSSLQFNDWIEVYYRVHQSCWLVEGLKHTIPVQISFREFSKILIFDDGITVTDAIEMLLESIEEDQETQQKHIYELYLQCYNKNDSSFCMEGERLLVSFGLHPQDTLVLKRRNQEIEEISVENVEKNQVKPRVLPMLKTPITFRLTVLFPDLQLFQIFTVNSNMTVEQLKVLIMSRIADHPKFFNAFRVENEEERMLLLQGHSLSIPSKFGDSSKTIWMENDMTLSQYPVHLYPLIEFTKQLCGKIMVLDTHMNCVELKVPLHTVSFSKLLIYSNDARVKTIVSTIKESLADYFAESFEFYGLYLPSLSDSSEWLKDERTLASYELDIHDCIEFKEDSRYNEIMMAAAKAFSITPTPHLLEGESIQFKKDYIHYISSSGKSIGTLYLTNYRILFMSNDRSTYDDTDDIRNVPLACIDTCQDSKQVDYIGVSISCKDWRTFALGFSTLDIRNQFLKIYKDISNFSSPDKLFAFSNKEKLLVENGWDIFDIVAEYTRQGVYPSSQWRLTDINKNYKISPTYPKKILVPASISDEDLVHSSNYRTRGRFPATCWIHPHNKASLTRCAQPKVGITRSRCAPDEALLNEIMKLSNNSVLYVIDSRPLANAVANTIMGKGTESTESYQFCKLKFLGIGNIHVMRESYNRLRNLCLASDGNSINWLSDLESTGWLENISQILAGVVAVVDLLDKGYSVITHCSDGWDRTAQLTALAQLLLDPHYRTYIGFISLIEKEWLSFGHKFQERCGLGPRSQQEESPIFIQFIDIVWQILKQFPCSFQFNEHLLLTILDHLNSCRFGTFLYNCERERAEANLQKKTISLWSFVLSNIEQFLNPHYTITTRVLYPVPDLKRLQLWNNCYFRWDRKMKEQESTEAKTRQIREKCDQLTHQLREVEKQNKQKQKM